MPFVTRTTLFFALTEFGRDLKCSEDTTLIFSLPRMFIHSRIAGKYNEFRINLWARW
jgi:hypothetical protein